MGNKGNKVSKETKKFSGITEDFYTKYTKVFDGCINSNHLINNFECIGLMDPYPFEYNPHGTVAKLPDGPMDLVYPKHRYMEGDSPGCIYIPNKDIMFRMMRACVRVKLPTELWCYRDGKWLTNLKKAESRAKKKK